MRPTATQTIWTCILLVQLGLTGRLLWQAFRTETGLEMLRLQWTDATWGWVVGSRRPIHNREPITQGQYWLDQVDEIRVIDGRDAATVMGAALVLDRPAQGYVGKYLVAETVPGFGLSTHVDHKAMQLAEDAFETRCEARCLELARKATELDPANVEWWRLRALLLWQSQNEDSPRADNWTDVLEEAARHDPDNALYDYLATYAYWQSSAEFESQGSDMHLVVRDPEEFNLGVDHFDQGQKKPFFTIGDAALTAAAEFLSRTDVPLSDHAAILESRRVDIRRDELLHGIWTWQNCRANEAARKGDLNQALARNRKNLQMIKQLTDAGPWTEFNVVIHALRAATTSQMYLIAQKHKKSFSEAEIADLKALAEHAGLTQAILMRAAQNLPMNRPRKRPGLALTGSSVSLVKGFALELLPPLLFALAIVSLMLVGLSRLTIQGDDPKAGIIGHTLSFATALAFTTLVFGLAPSEIIPSAVQAWVLTILLVSSPLVLSLWVGWTWLRRRSFQFTIRSMLTCMLAHSVLFGIVSLARPDGESFLLLPFELSIPPRGWNDLDARSLDAAFRSHRTWLWPAFQWIAYNGPYTTVAVWAGITACLLRIKAARADAKIGSVDRSFHRLSAAWSRSFGYACFTLACFMAILYLSLAPAGIVAADQEFQEKMSFAQSPGDHWSNVEKAVQQVRSNPKLVGQLKSDVENELERNSFGSE